MKMTILLKYISFQSSIFEPDQWSFPRSVCLVQVRGSKEILLYETGQINFSYVASIPKASISVVMTSHLTSARETNTEINGQSMESTVLLHHQKQLRRTDLRWTMTEKIKRKLETVAIKSYRLYFRSIRFE